MFTRINEDPKILNKNRVPKNFENQRRKCAVVSIYAKMKYKAYTFLTKISKKWTRTKKKLLKLFGKKFKYINNLLVFKQDFQPKENNTIFFCHVYNY